MSERIKDASVELLSAIDARWGGETLRKREAAISPRMESAIKRLSELTGFIGARGV